MWARWSRACGRAARSLLLAYEYRACIKLAAARTPKQGLASAFQRSCVDLRTMKDVGPYGFWDVPPPYRLWYWLDDAKRARVDLGLAAA